MYSRQWRRMNRSFSCFLSLFLTCRRETRWHHGAAVHCGRIYGLKVCDGVCVCLHLWIRSFLPVCLSLPPTALQKKVHCIPWTDGEAQWHDAPSSPRGKGAASLFSSCLVMVLECWGGEGGNRQLGYLHVDHDAEGEDACQCQRAAVTLCRWLWPGDSARRSCI